MGVAARFRMCYLAAAFLFFGCFRLSYGEIPNDQAPVGGRPAAGGMSGGHDDAGADPTDAGGLDGGSLDPCSGDSVIDTDRDGVCDRDDLCEGHDDTTDDDQNGVPDGCDLASCGNRQLDPGETCDPSSSDDACPDTCPAPGVCQKNTLQGQPQACNVECALSSITAAIDDDGCCPNGADATSDSDCSPVCGNQILEAGEECDGGSVCNSNCLWTPEGQCLLFEGTATELCKQCRCAECTQEMTTCFGSDSGFSEYCAPIVNCGDVARCFGDDCYCGDSVSCASPNGPCRDEVDAAAEAAGQQSQVCVGSLSCAGYHASALGACELDRCTSECTE